MIKSQKLINTSAWIFLLFFVQQAFAQQTENISSPDRGFVSSKPATHWEQALVCGNGKYGALVKVTIQSNLGNDCVIRSACSMKADGINLIAEKQGDYFMLKFKTEKGANYILSAN